MLPAVPHHYRLAQYTHVGNREVHALGARGRHNMRGIAREHQPAIAHRLHDEAAHCRDALLQDRAFDEVRRVVAFEAAVQLVPDAFVGPLREVFVGLALEVHALDRRRALAEQREAARRGACR